MCLFQNSLQDSLQTFHEVSHNFYLEKTDFILFLNKHDLFVEKLKAACFQDSIKEYTGMCDYRIYKLSPVKRICVLEHSVMTNCNCACPAIQRGYGSGFLSESSS